MCIMIRHWNEGLCSVKLKKKKFTFSKDFQITSCKNKTLCIESTQYLNHFVNGNTIIPFKSLIKQSHLGVNSSPKSRKGTSQVLKIPSKLGRGGVSSRHHVLKLPSPCVTNPDISKGVSVSFVPETILSSTFWHGIPLEMRSGY